MKLKSIALWSLGISIVSLLISISILVNYCPTQNLQFDYMGVIVGILALLITALIGAQVSQYIFVDKKIEKIASRITRIIAHKSANDIAKRVAKETAEQAIENLAKDFSVVAHGKELMKDVPSQSSFGMYIPVIDAIFNAINEFNKCTYSTLSESAIEDAYLSLQKTFESCTKQGVPRILEGRKEFYQSVLSTAPRNHKEFCNSYLEEAQGYPADIDHIIREKEDSAEYETLLKEGKILDD